MDSNAKVNPWMVSTLVLVGVVVGFGGGQLFGKGSEAAVPRPAAKEIFAPAPAPAPTFGSGEIKIAEVTDKDHIRGAKNAKVTLIEFSDTECPFCKRFHMTMKQVIEKYSNDVRWVYRHFPLDSLHSKARKEAEATECAAELGGEEKFWAYIDRLFEVTPSNDRLELSELPNIAVFVGLNRAKFEECLESGRQAGRVAEQLLDATTAGGDGTPYTVLISQNGEKIPLSGALPFEKMAGAIDQALQAK